MVSETTRATPVSKKIYIAFGNKCRSNEREIADVLENLMKSYIKKGEKIFLEN